MPDATQAMESSFLNADTVKGLSKKMATIINAGKYEETDYGTKLTIQVEVDGRLKDWRISRDSVKNIVQEYGLKTEKWIGRQVRLQVVNINGKESVLAFPFDVVKTEFVGVHMGADTNSDY